MTKPLLLSKNTLIELYINKGYSQRKVAKILKCGNTTIYTYLKKYKIPTRSKFYKTENFKQQMKNRKFTKEHRKKLSLAKKGKKRSKETIQKLQKAFRGKKNPAWRGGKIKYRGWEFILQRPNVLKRDKYQCQICLKDANNVHHLIPYRISKDNSLFNLITLCSKHHKYMDEYFDYKYGYGNYNKKDNYMEEMKKWEHIVQ